MLSSRSILCIFLGFFAFALLAFASPIEVESGLVARSPGALDIPAQTGELAKRNGGQDILDILVKLKASVDINANLLSECMHSSSNPSG